MNPRMRRYNQTFDPGHDERVEPYRGIEPHMPDPDWGSILVNPEQKKAPLGDPTIWGNAITTLIDADPINGTTPRVIFGDQIVLVQPSDKYSRSWSLTGAVLTFSAAWATDTDVTPPAYIGEIDALSPLAVWLDIQQGIDKTIIQQQLLLMSGGVDPLTGAGNYGLCNQQFTGGGGPYGVTFNENPPVLSATLQQQRPFAGVTLVGNTINIRAIFTRGGVVGQPVTIPSATVSLMLTPFAPGHGL